MINFSNYKKLIFLDKFEKEFCQKGIFSPNPIGKPILIQCVNDIFYLKLFSLVIENEHKNVNKIYGVICSPLNLKFKDIILLIPMIIKLFVNHLNKKKLKKMYSSIGVTQFYDQADLSFRLKSTNIFKAAKIFFEIKNKKQLISFSYKGIRCGDLIYDTVVRFSKKIPTLNLKSFSYFLSLHRSINQITYFLNIPNIPNFQKVFFSQAVYTYHGIPLRVFLKKSSKVFTSGNFTQMFKLHSFDDIYMMETTKSYKNILKKIDFNNKIIQNSLKVFSSRFEGKDDTGYIKLMKSNPYVDYNVQFDNYQSIDGVLFLHDFYDAHKLYGEVIFNDFYEWAIFTLDIIREYNLKIAIKPHPYQIPESLRFQEKIKEIYKDLIWLNPLISNISLFKRNIKFGISHHGTVIPELAFFGIKCIYCAENPVSAFNIGFFAKNRNQYKDLILNVNSLKNCNNLKTEVAKYYYIHYIHKSSDYMIKRKVVDGINIKNINRMNMKTKELLN